ncbi:TPA: type IV pilus biogenesis protein PilM [Salmonella enterica]|uniref:Pilus assembly protein PilM n=1 Tax=Salmonella enterica subsp. enterica serovar Eastbourne TaxID=486993 RepID=A0A702BIB0_SALET|nr:type IV pilus biogenesis protein PilM [Salmonella enterica]EBZ9516239.1 pilus assembly protein PilM [Salmonella enterica subsp. enterica serovar Eastbourne]EDU7787050.1 type IV pilus biogenesis protein PilM [Salmonella enterica subsp. enterica serovar Oranienburg]EGB1030836.1 type IV pilus biogenesis protein PilM [Salmonella enterica subsp. enterica serovar Reading]HEC0613343.1 type IV pilus biogenesis protein PilM [Salmonella enterica subsp. enterica serovar Havana]ECA1897848.1 pilus assem
MKSFVVISLLFLWLAFYGNLRDDNDNYAASLREGKALLFLNYVNVFDSYYELNPDYNGDVTHNVTAPSWLPANVDIQMFIENKRGYVFMPAYPGVYNNILKRTEGSVLVGVSDSSSLVTEAGRINKPSFIPSGYIVYMR